MNWCSWPCVFCWLQFVSELQTVWTSLHHIQRGAADRCGGETACDSCECVLYVCVYRHLNNIFKCCFPEDYWCVQLPGYSQSIGRRHFHPNSAKSKHEKYTYQQLWSPIINMLVVFVFLFFFLFVYNERNVKTAIWGFRGTL